MVFCDNYGEIMQANPVLAEAWRGNFVENRHRGAFCFARANGEIIASAGDIDRPIFPRSAIKSMQALALFRSGAVEKFGLDAEAIALACASHNAEPEHIEAVGRFLKKVGCEITDLECGAQPPVDARTRLALQASGEDFSAIHNNCSGKHAGMLGVAKALGVPTKGYAERDHPVQKLVRACVEEIVDTQMTTDRCGTDGCSIPTWAAPLKSFAQGFARMATGEGLEPDLAKASRAAFDAATKFPFMVRGSDTLDTDVMTAFEGSVMVKIGADGVFCGALRNQGIGFALKIDDGNLKVADVVIAALLNCMSKPNAHQSDVLNHYATQTLTNWRKIDVGKIVATDATQLAF